jgi:MoxR-like ATPase
MNVERWRANSDQTSESQLGLLRERKEPSIGDLNPLLFPPEFTRRETVEALCLAIERGLEKYEGLKPESMGVTWIRLSDGKQAPRFVVRWTKDLLSEEQISFLEELITTTYRPHRVATRKNFNGIQRRNPSFYPKVEASFLEPKNKRYDYNTIGWVMGTSASSEPDHETEGLLLYRRINHQGVATSMKGENKNDWFTLPQPVDYKGKPISTQHLVEIRVANLYQTELVKFVLQTARILNDKPPLPGAHLSYEIYQSLNRLGLKRRERKDIYGLDEVIDYIEKYLFFPLCHLEETLRRKIEISSVLLIGVPGTGKTLLAEYFLQREDLGVFLVPVPIQTLARDLAEKKTIIERISSVSQEIGIPVVLQVDDVDTIAKETETINTTLMNLMAGVRERGFFILASTNKPYDLDDRLLQPERFGHVLHIPLPDEEARFGILKIHAPEEYFANPQEKGTILSALAKATEGFDSRFLKALCDWAQITAMKRNPFGGKLDIEDFDESLRVMLQRFRREDVCKKERELAKFANNHQVYLPGFHKKAEKTQDLTQLVAELKKNPKI